MTDAPYYKKAWELSDESALTISSMRKAQSPMNCSVVPVTDPDYSIFPPGNIRLLAIRVAELHDFFEEQFVTEISANDSIKYIA